MLNGAAVTATISKLLPNRRRDGAVAATVLWRLRDGWLVGLLNGAAVTATISKLLPNRHRDGAAAATTSVLRCLRDGGLVRLLNGAAAGFSLSRGAYVSVPNFGLFAPGSIPARAQAWHWLGLEAQRAAVAAYLNGGSWRLEAEFVETESGKRSDNRPQLAAALAACKKLKAKLVVAKLDRLSRNLAFIAALMDSGVEFVAVDNPHATRLTLRILAAVAEHERAMISERTKAALAAAKARGRKLGGPKLALATKLGNAGGARGSRPRCAWDRG